MGFYTLIFRLYVERLNYFSDSNRTVYSLLDQAAILTVIPANNLMTLVFRCYARFGTFVQLSHILQVSSLTNKFDFRPADVFMINRFKPDIQQNDIINRITTSKK